MCYMMKSRPGKMVKNLKTSWSMGKDHWGKPVGPVPKTHDQIPIGRKPKIEVEKFKLVKKETWKPVEKGGKPRKNVYYRGILSVDGIRINFEIHLMSDDGSISCVSSSIPRYRITMANEPYAYILRLGDLFLKSFSAKEGTITWGKALNAKVFLSKKQAKEIRATIKYILKSKVKVEAIDNLGDFKKQWAVTPPVFCSEEDCENSACLGSLHCYNHGGLYLGDMTNSWYSGEFKPI